MILVILIIAALAMVGLFVLWMLLFTSARPEILGFVYHLLFMHKKKSYESVPGYYLYWVLINGNSHMFENAVNELMKRGVNTTFTRDEILNLGLESKKLEWARRNRLNAVAGVLDTRLNTLNDKKAQRRAKLMKYIVLRFWGTPRQKEELETTEDSST